MTTRARRDLVVAVDVAAPASAVWDLVTDWERQREWILATRVRVVAGDGRSAGSEVVAVTGIGDVGVVDTFTVTAFEPAAEGGGRIDVRHTGLVVTGDSSFLVEAWGPDRCRFTWTEVTRNRAHTIRRLADVVEQARRRPLPTTDVTR